MKYTKLFLLSTLFLGGTLVAHESEAKEGEKETSKGKENLQTQTLHYSVL